MRKNYLIIAIFFFFSGVNSKDQSIFSSIKSCFCEGGILFGQASKNDRIFIQNKKINISDDGYFIFAFGREFSEDLRIKINGKEKKINIKKKKYKIERINNLEKNKVVPKQEDLIKIKEDQKIIRLSKKKGINVKLFEEPFIIPVKGRISGVFGSQRILNNKPRRPHYGIDIAAPKGTKIFSPAGGLIKLVAKDMFFTGNTVIIDHGLGLISIFAHLEQILVSEGDEVEIGNIIGLVGQTGRATGPHLHWGIYLENIPVDPNVFLDSIKSN